MADVRCCWLTLRGPWVYPPSPPSFCCTATAERGSVAVSTTRTAVRTAFLRLPNSSRVSSTSPLKSVAIIYAVRLCWLLRVPVNKRGVCLCTAASRHFRFLRCTARTSFAAVLRAALRPLWRGERTLHCVVWVDDGRGGTLVLQPAQHPCLCRRTERRAGLSSNAVTYPRTRFAPGDGDIKRSSFEVYR